MKHLKNFIRILWIINNFISYFTWIFKAKVTSILLNIKKIDYMSYEVLFKLE